MNEERQATSDELGARDSRRGQSTPLVSVIIPAYNCAALIGETLDSVFAQTFGDYEVLVVNDGSPDADELGRVVARYGGRVHYLSQENRGAAAARNLALGAARGAYIAFLDADDAWLPEYLAEQVNFIERGGYDLVYANALHVGDSPLAGRTYMETSPSVGEVTFGSLVRGDCNVITSGVVARREAVLRAGLFDESLRNSHDFDLWLRLTRGGARLSYQRKVLLRYNNREGSLSGDAVNRAKRELRVYFKIRETLELSDDERVEIERAIRRTERELSLVEAKAHLERGEFALARESFRKADELQPSWKLKAARALLRLWPGLLRSIHLRRA